MNKCIECGTSTSNPKFCSRKCAVTTNNRLFPKRIKSKKCHVCGDPILSNRKYCSKHIPDQTTDLSTTYSQMRGSLKYQKNSKIRDRSRRVYLRSNLPKACAICGYDKHIEVCHIVPISDHPPEATLAQINDLKNLIGLCPNHHWELDKGLLPLEEVLSKHPLHKSL